MSHGRTALRTALALGVACVLATGCSRPAAEAAAERTKPPAPTDGEVRIQEASRPFIEVQVVSGSTSGSTLIAPARVDFRDGAVSQVGAPLDGRVTAIHVLLGQRVEAGSPVVTLDCPDAAAMRASDTVAQSALREARLELDRQHRMQQEGVGVERDLVAAETKVAGAEAEVARAASGANSIGGGSAAAVVVRAPITGIVIARKASVGMVVQRGADPLVEIGDTSALWVVADVFERDLSQVKIGAKTLVTFTSANHQMEARVASLGSVIAPGLRTVPVFLALDRRDASLRPGMFGRVAIDSSDAVVTLPVNAVLIKEGKAPVVYVQKDPLTFERRTVVVAQPVEGRVQIVSGLAPGEKVVVRGALLLDGSADQLL